MRKSVILKRKAKQEHSDISNRVQQFLRFLDGYEDATYKNMHRVQTFPQLKLEEGSYLAIGVIKDEFSRLFLYEEFECNNIEKK